MSKKGGRKNRDTRTVISPETWHQIKNRLIAEAPEGLKPHEAENWANKEILKTYKLSSQVRKRL